MIALSPPPWERGGNMEVAQSHPIQNVHQVERLASILAGGSLALFGVRQGLKYHSIAASTGLTLAGAALIKRGVTGYCDIYRALGVQTADDHPGANTSIGYQQGFRVDRSITINAPREQVYDFWRRLENLPRIMQYVHCIKQTDEK